MLEYVQRLPFVRQVMTVALRPYQHLLGIAINQLPITVLPAHSALIS